MSDDSYARYRKNDPHGRAGSPGSSPRGEDDPLAELARLIGQDQSEPSPDWHAAPASYEGYQYPGEQPSDPRYANPGYPTRDPYQGGGHDPHYSAQPLDSQSYGSQTYGDQHFQSDTYRQGYDPVYGQGGQQPGYQVGTYFGENDHGQDEDYEESSSRGSRGGLVTVVAVLCLAVLGTAGAFAYRSLFGGSAPNSPPVILADAAPNKIVPTNQPSDNSGQPGSARPDLGPAERMVSREERPLNVQGTTSGSPGVVFPSNSPIPQPSMSPNTVLAPAPAPQSAPGEPRKVRTVIIRPDQQGDQTGQTSAARVASNAAAFPTGSAAARNGNQKPTPPAAGAEPQGEAPLSLAPQGQSPDSSPAHAKLASTVSRPVPAPATSPAVAAAGSFFVQLAAQKSEEDAQMTFRAIQAKYPGQLGGRQPVIRRKDLEKGVFYGVQVGPFASREEAVQLCESLKSAGGACMIQKN